MKLAPDAAPAESWVRIDEWAKSALADGRVFRRRGRKQISRRAEALLVTTIPDAFGLRIPRHTSPRLSSHYGIMVPCMDNLHFAIPGASQNAM